MGLGRGVSTLVALGLRAAALFGGRLRVLLLEGQALGAQGKLYAVDTADGSLDRTLLDLQLTPGPSLMVMRPSWEYPPAPERWFHQTTLPALPSLCYISYSRAPASGPPSGTIATIVNSSPR
jgi:hypothetical protein